mmetsp:Transcript_25667/g.68151  ORF Transcript_25667/g.68151 Transcript_25667/m.68151 type:complete len:292 (-) Transcript_25667:400-1275(-)
MQSGTCTSKCNRTITSMHTVQLRHLQCQQLLLLRPHAHRTNSRLALEQPASAICQLQVADAIVTDHLLRDPKVLAGQHVVTCPRGADVGGRADVHVQAVAGVEAPEAGRLGRLVRPPRQRRTAECRRRLRCKRRCGKLVLVLVERHGGNRRLRKRRRGNTSLALVARDGGKAAEQGHGVCLGPQQPVAHNPRGLQRGGLVLPSNLQHLLRRLESRGTERPHRVDGLLAFLMGSDLRKQVLVDILHLLHVVSWRPTWHLLRGLHLLNGGSLAGHRLRIGAAGDLLDSGRGPA